jgi:hypothetical protein
MVPRFSEMSKVLVTDGENEPYDGYVIARGIESTKPTMAAKIKFTEIKEDEWPICPSCKKELREVKYKQGGWVSTWAAFWCPHCRCLLSVSTTFNG